MGPPACVTAMKYFNKTLELNCWRTLYICFELGWAQCLAVWFGWWQLFNQTATVTQLPYPKLITSCVRWAECLLEVPINIWNRSRPDVTLVRSGRHAAFSLTSQGTRDPNQTDCEWDKKNECKKRTEIVAVRVCACPKVGTAAAIDENSWSSPEGSHVKVCQFTEQVLQSLFALCVVQEKKESRPDPSWRNHTQCWLRILGVKISYFRRLLPQWSVCTGWSIRLYTTSLYSLILKRNSQFDVHKM